ncbi:MAG: acyltransferase family protein [Anaerolineae bacterium]|nr:acyltransferase family protein [Anaerolineae bacterium]
MHYLDWLRVAAILGVFLYHAVHPFDLTGWHVKNAEQSDFITALLLMVSPWGMPFFFMIAGTGTWFALRKRTAVQYIGERFRRLLVPFIAGCLLLTPVMLYFEWMHNTQTNLWTLSFGEYVASRQIPISCQFFGWAGLHLWFLGFLFSYSLVALPLFLWLRGTTGKRALDWAAQLSERRGGILLVILPLLLIQLVFRPFFSTGEHNWADFFYMLGFFVMGYVLYSDERFARAIHRDWRLLFVIGVLTTLIGVGAIAYSRGMEWIENPALPQFYLMYTLIVVNGWCWTAFLLYGGMRFLNYTNRWLRYGQDAILPFFVFHQPVIIVIAFFVVQWEADILPKLLVVVPTSFVVTLAIYEGIVRRSRRLQALFGMKVQHLPISSSGDADVQKPAHAR